MRSQSTIKSGCPFLKGYRQASISVLALMVVTARVLVFVSGSLTSWLEVGPTFNTITFMS